MKIGTIKIYKKKFDLFCEVELINGKACCKLFTNQLPAKIITPSIFNLINGIRDCSLVCKEFKGIDYCILNILLNLKSLYTDPNKVIKALSKIKTDKLRFNIKLKDFKTILMHEVAEKM